ncbi:phytoene/squalene synthase family protein [Pseudomonas sp. CFBP 13719]|uniref:phytoene/squalene synthase family protein n=1 Tax=Pseudomonas sp. CFBP 13719 TaxID=2775303 RepID=UPI0017860324|nr:phytoene/squalene synthase family protein [Pseudomonas sp. CFBP 13719]MBD8682923.1 phytoene/squalene synthase family protein [Pseudomonas sp. CFBP 13719]
MSTSAPDPALREHAEQSIAVGSKSFAAAAKLFDERTRRSAVMLYAWCRHCDDVIDGQQAGHDAVPISPEQAQRRLALLQAQTRAVYAGEPASEPAFAAFAEVVREHGIPEHNAMEHLAGFEMDVVDRRYHTQDDTLQYCYHVAGVVGLMMARVMGTDDPRTLDRACDLGLAFQLTNIARDIVEDARVGRCYLPAQWLDELNIPLQDLAAPEHRPAVAVLARRLVDLAEPYYASAQAGLAALPWRSAWAVATAAAVYRQIGVKVVAAGSRAWDARVSTSKAEKLAAVSQGGWRAVSARWRQWPQRPAQLWSRPHPPCAAAPGATREAAHANAS